MKAAFFDLPPQPDSSWMKPNGQSQPRPHGAQPTHRIMDIIHSSCIKTKFLRGLLYSNSDPKHKPSPLTAHVFPHAVCSFFILFSDWKEHSYSFFKTQLIPLLSWMERYRHTHNLLEGISVPRLRFSCIGVKSKITML